jgi:aminoglycoside phosphotransferase family enzyme/predicted kinase
MQTEDQSEVMAFLEAPSTHGGRPVERVDTHASVVFLAGDRAWKLKRAVRYEFLDFSTVERRRDMCEAELRINRRVSPELYLRVVPVTRETDGRLQLAGGGTPLDWVIEMVRFDQAVLFDRLAERHALPLDWMPPLAEAIATAHAGAEHVNDRGGVAGIRWVIDGNEEAFGEPFADILDRAASAAAIAGARGEVDRHRGLLESRRAAGFVRRCHGDLHLRNIVLLNDRPALFDAIEFNDAISCIDVLYDISFLVMDLWHRGLRHHANLVLNAYLNRTSHDGLALLPLFLSCRAAVRAKTDSLEARLQPEPDHRAALEDAARSYLDLAVELLRPRQPVLMAIGGLSGSGKSTVAYRLAPLVGRTPGAMVLRSDEIRKRLLGVDPLARLGSGAYTQEASARVYDALVSSASSILGAGHAAIVDAVFARASDREAIESAAKRANVRFAGIWLDAPESLRLARVGARERDASDADARVVREQSVTDAGDVGWHRIDGAQPIDDVVRQIAARGEAA